MRRILLLLAMLTSALAAADPPRVLVLLSYHRGMAWEDAIVRGLERSLAGTAEPVYVHFDHKRFPDPAAAAVRAAVAADAARTSRPAAILAVDDFAWRLALEQRDRLGSGLPLLFCGINHWDGAKRPANTTGVVETYDVTDTLDLALRMHPRAERIVVVNDATETGEANSAALAHVLPTAARGRAVENIGLGTFAETGALLAGLDPARDLVLLLNWNIDSTGAPRSHEEAVRAARAASPAPIYGVWDFQFGLGIAGGSLMDGEMHGAEAGELVAQVLAGTPASALPVHDRPRTRRVLDARELERFGIDPIDVPDGIEVAHVSSSFLRDHGALIALVTVVILAQAATIGGLLLAMRRRRLAEAARRQAEERMQHGARMDAVGQLAAGVAHDFNNVLTAILGHADLLSMRLEPGSPLRVHAETIGGAAQRAAGTVRNLLTFARGRGSAASSCDANRLAEDVVALLQHAIDRRIRIERALDPQAGLVRVGADELQQLLINLALNARDAMPHGGRIEIATRRLAVAPDEAAGLGLPPGAYVLIAVSDSGAGIPPEVLPRIFEPFFTTKGPGKGSGLGLAVVHGIVTSARGAIRCDSRPGEGARFSVWLPAGSAESTRVHRKESAKRGLRVLLVDDEEPVLRVIEGLLAAVGASVIAIGEPARAEAWFLDHADEIDAVILDGNMPGIAGWQLAARLREIRDELPIIALTGAATDEAVQAWRAAGVERVLHKPVTRAQLEDALVAAVPG
jgi:signal transduction histidine kinase/ActR/RegA family two-component response regulator